MVIYCLRDETIRRLGSVAHALRGFGLGELVVVLGLLDGD